MLKSDIDAMKSLSDKQLAILNAEILQRKKSLLAAYLLWLVLGQFGAHNFYLGKILWGVFYIVLGLLGLISILGEFVVLGAAGGAGGALMGLGGILLGSLGALMLWDLFTLPFQMRRKERQVKEKLLSEIRSGFPAAA